MPEPAELPDDEAVATYLGPQALNVSAEQVADALAAETAAQASICRVEPYTLDLRQALLRRVARNLAMRGIPLGVQSDELGSMRIGANDPEVRRLEGPRRKRVVG